MPPAWRQVTLLAMCGGLLGVLAMIPLMAVWRNFFLGAEPTKGWGPFKRYDAPTADRISREEMHRMGIDLPEATAGGGSDGNTTSQYTATLDGLGIVGDGAHAVGEHVELDNLIPRTALLAALLLAPIQLPGGGET